jgi:hypothetical protein
MGHVKKMDMPSAAASTASSETGKRETSYLFGVGVLGAAKFSRGLKFSATCGARGIFGLNESAANNNAGGLDIICRL